jgi:predicted nucleic acid-binding protein
MNVFVDTSALYAILDADDEQHAEAKRIWIRLLEERASLHTNNYILVETSALLQSRIGMAAYRTFVAEILPVIELVWVEEGIHRSAQHALLISKRRALSLVDCVSFESMRRLGLSSVFCFDPHFKEQGFLPVS